MVEPSFFLDVLGVAAAFPAVDGVIIFLQPEIGDLPSGCVEVGRPAEDRLGKGGDAEGVFGENESDEESRLVDDDGPSSAEAPQDGNVVLFDARKVEERGRVAGDPHDDGAGRS